MNFSIGCEYMNHLDKLVFNELKRYGESIGKLIIQSDRMNKVYDPAIISEYDIPRDIVYRTLTKSIDITDSQLETVSNIVDATKDIIKEITHANVIFLKSIETISTPIQKLNEETGRISLNHEMRINFFEWNEWNGNRFEFIKSAIKVKDDNNDMNSSAFLWGNEVSLDRMFSFFEKSTRR